MALSKERLYTRAATENALGRSSSRGTSAAPSLGGASSCVGSEQGLNRLVCRLRRPIEGGFGFLVQGTYPNKMTVRQVFVEGPAQGILREGDHIVLVNGINTMRMTHDMLLELLHRIPRGDCVTFTVLRQDDDEPRLRSESAVLGPQLTSQTPDRMSQLTIVCTFLS